MRAENLRADLRTQRLDFPAALVVSGHTWTVANLLSISRLLFCVPIVLALLRCTPVGDWIAFSMMVWAAISDVIDGALARRTGSKSRLGAVLDPVADKVLIASIVVTLILVRSFPIWAAVLIIGRDVAILSVGGWLLRKKGELLESNTLGKVTGFVFACAIASYTLNVRVLSLPMAYLSAVFVVISSVSYSVRLLGKLKGRLQ